MRPARETLHAFRTAVESIVEAGGTVTPAYRHIDERWQLTTTPPTFTQLAVAAVLGDASPEEVGNALALAFTGDGDQIRRAEVLNTVAAEVEKRLRAEYAKVAAANYESLRERFNKTAAELTEAAATTRPEASASEMLTESAKARSAWMALPLLAEALDAQLNALKTAAALAKKAAPTELFDYAVTVNANSPAELRRTVWEAWESEQPIQGNRWSALSAINGVQLNARSLGELVPYRKPQPIETRYLPGNSGGLRPVQYDPELDEPKGARRAG